MGIGFLILFSGFGMGVAVCWDWWVVGTGEEVLFYDSCVVVLFCGGWVFSCD